MAYQLWRNCLLLLAQLSHTRVHTQGARTHADTHVCARRLLFGLGRLCPQLYIGSFSASPTACLLCWYGRAGTQNGRFAEAVVLSTGLSINRTIDGAVGDAEIEPM